MTTTAKERPILFNTEMVRAILDGRKTVTRRPVRQRWERGEPTQTTDGTWVFADRAQTINVIGDCPYGVPGDRLWVREAWAECSVADASSLGSASARVGVDHPAEGGVGVTYRIEFLGMDDDIHWRHADLLPRWASRITLEVTDVRVERVQEITPHEVEREGVALQAWSCDPTWPPTAGFAEVWGATYADGPHAWERNPWVWVVSFRRVEM